MRISECITLGIDGRFNSSLIVEQFREENNRMDNTHTPIAFVMTVAELLLVVQTERGSVSVVPATFPCLRNADQSSPSPLHVD